MKPLTHYKYQQDVALAQINPEKHGPDTTYKTSSDQDTESGTLFTMPCSSNGSASSFSESPLLNTASLDPKNVLSRIGLKGCIGWTPLPRIKTRSCLHTNFACGKPTGRNQYGNTLTQLNIKSVMLFYVLGLVGKMSIVCGTWPLRRIKFVPTAVMTSLVDIKCDSEIKQSPFVYDN